MDMGDSPFRLDSPKGRVPARVGRGGGIPLDAERLGTMLDDEGPAEYRLGLGELVADFEYPLLGPAPNEASPRAPELESRRETPGGAGAAREGSKWEVLSKPVGDAMGGERKADGACTPPCWTRGELEAETMPKDMSVPGE